MTGHTPHLTVLAGPNGAGKSTSAPLLLKGTLGVTEFVNADVVALGLSAFAPEKAALQAGKIMLERLKELARNRQNFAFETTLASRSFAPWISKLRGTGYRAHLVFLWLPSPEHAIARVAERVRLGGHSVPEDVIRRRYGAGLKNFFNLYLPVVDSWSIYDNSSRNKARLIASREARARPDVMDRSLWQELKSRYAKA